MPTYLKSIQPDLAKQTNRIYIPLIATKHSNSSIWNQKTTRILKVTSITQLNECFYICQYRQVLQEFINMSKSNAAHSLLQLTLSSLSLKQEVNKAIDKLIA